MHLSGPVVYNRKLECSDGEHCGNNDVSKRNAAAVVVFSFLVVGFSLEKSPCDDKSVSLFNAACYDCFLLRRILVMTSL